MSRKSSDVVSASEIASWAWCPESWRLEALGAEPENQAALARGSAFHADRSTFEVLSRRAVSAGMWLVVLAVLVVAAWYALVAGRG